MTANGYTPSTGVTTTGSAIAAGNYTITSTGLAAWGLTDADASLTALAVWEPANL